METFDNPNYATQKLVFWVLAFVPIVYLGLLYLLDTLTFDANATPLDLPFNLLAGILGIISIIEIVIVTKLLIPSVINKTSIEEKYGLLLMGSNLYQAIAIYGLLLGILQIFVVIEHVNWLISGSFIILSMFLQIVFIQTTVDTHLKLK